MNLMRRIRAMLQTAAIWGAAWTVPGLLWVTVLAFLQRNSAAQPHPNVSGFLWTILLNWTAVGPIGGAAFALTLSVAERRKSSLGGLSLRRVASWGAIGGVCLPIALYPTLSGTIPNPMQQLVLDVVVYGALGAASAAASVRLAQRELLPLSTKAPG